MLLWHHSTNGSGFLGGLEQYHVAQESHAVEMVAYNLMGCSFVNTPDRSSSRF